MAPRKALKVAASSSAGEAEMVEAVKTADWVAAASAALRRGAQSVRGDGTEQAALEKMAAEAARRQEEEKVARAHEVVRVAAEATERREKEEEEAKAREAKAPKADESAAPETEKATATTATGQASMTLLSQGGIEEQVVDTISVESHDPREKGTADPETIHPQRVPLLEAPEGSSALARLHVTPRARESVSWRAAPTRRSARSSPFTRTRRRPSGSGSSPTARWWFDR